MTCDFVSRTFIAQASGKEMKGDYSGGRHLFVILKIKYKGLIYFTKAILRESLVPPDSRTATYTPQERPTAVNVTS